MSLLRPLRGTKSVLLSCVMLLLMFASAKAQSPVASFAVAQTSGCVPFSVQFTNTSQNATIWYWDFGNGNYSTAFEPSNIYVNSGSYTVKLVATNTLGQSDSVVMQGYINPVQPPLVNFSVSATMQCLESNSIIFTNQSANYDSCMWDFGDGNTSNAINPVHQYSAPGIYTITLIAYNTALGCTTSHSKNALVEILSNPAATFSANIISTCNVQSTITFSAQASSAISWNWQFGDGNSSTQQQPVHVYGQPGVYDVTLITTNQLGCTDTLVKPAYITVLANPVPVINNSGTLSGCSPLGTTFSTPATGVTAWSWNLGDSTYGQTPYRSHTYHNPGSYVVTLQVTYQNGCVNSDTIHVHAWPKPTGSYTMNNTSGCVPLTTNFNNQTTGAGNQYTWNFGDGNTSNAVSPSHTYTTPGSYLSSLTVTNTFGCSAIFHIYPFIYVSQANAQFTADNLSGCAPHTVNFTHPGGAIYNYLWDFGDGSTSTQQSPSHTYNTIGNYSVSLTVSNNTGCNNTFTLPSQVQVTQGTNNFNPTAPVVACAPFTINLYDNSPGAINWNWDFGDGNTSTSQSTVHTYTAAGTYNVSLQTQSGGSGCSQSVNPYSTYIINAGEADFTLTQTLCPPFTATFTDQSVNAIAWFWEFGDGNTSTLQHPVHVYSSPGNYNVILTITTADGCIFIKYHNYAVTFLPLSANATATTTDTILPYTVNFYANSTGATMWFWEFGDGNTSNLMNPVHIYTTPGPYNLTLTVSNPECTFTYEYESVTFGSGTVLPGGNNDTIPDPPPVYSCIPYEMSFSNPVQNTVAWLWDFGDGNTSTQQNPVHIYTDPGVFNVSLITWNQLGQTDTILQGAPFYLTGATSDFTITHANNCLGSTLQTHNTSVNAITYLWDFGDGTTSTLFEPSHVYSTTGVNYIISLLVTDSLGCTDYMARSYYAAAVLPVNASARRGCAGDTIQFNSGNINFISYLWDFGDGTTSTAQHPFHVYADSGNYQVTLTVTDAIGCTNSWQLPYGIKINKPVANFTTQITPNGCLAPEVSFINLSTGADSYVWAIGNTVFSTEQNPVRNIASPGNHNITLTVSADGCSDTLTINNAIYINWLRVNFSYSQNSNCYPITVTYADSSIDAVLWHWDFGDGTTSNQQHPTHTFQSKPQGKVTLTVTSATGCVKSLSKSNISAMEVNFAFNDTSGCSPFKMEVSDSSLSVATWLWDFGDGTFSTDPSPTHNYLSNGTFNVTLTATSSTGCTQVISPAATIKTTGPEAQFTMNTVVSCAPTIVRFYDNSNGASAWSWSFGNGNHSILENPVHIYNQPGTYDVTLVVTDSAGCSDTLQRQQLVHITGSIANFSVQSTSGCSPWQVAFADSSISAFNWLWNFGDGTTSTQQNPVHTYTVAGTYAVTLITQDTTGCQSVFTGPVPLLVQQPPVAAFSIVNPVGCAPHQVNFNNQSLGAQGYVWNFGDGTTSTTQNPQHQYATPGVYYVSLVVTNPDGCTDTLHQQTPVRVSQTPAPAFTVSTNQGCSPLQLQFSNNTNGDSTTVYSWDFGNGQTSAVQNPAVTYTQPGIYSVTLTATSNSVCSATVTQNNLIMVTDGTPPPPVLLKSVSVVDASVIDITWGNLPLQGLMAYNLYRYNTSSSQFDLIYTDSNPGNTSLNVTSNHPDSSVLTANRTYTYVVQAVNQCNVGTPLSQLNPHTSINLVTQVVSGLARLQWNKYTACSVDGYQVFRQDHMNGPFNHLGTVGPGTGIFYDSTVYCGMDARYVIKAFNLCGEGFEAWSDEEMLTVPGILAQQKVDIVRSTVVDDQYVFTEWAPPVLAPHLVTEFELYRSTDNVNFTLLQVLSSTTTNYSDFDTQVHLQNYYYLVKVKNVCELETTQGLESSSILLKADHNKQNNIHLRWTPYVNWDTGVDYYVIERLNDSGTWETVRVVNGDVTEVVEH